MLTYLFTLTQIFGSLTLFMYGMKTMSDGIQRAAGPQLRNVLRDVTKNRIRGVLTGLFTTAVIQSSSATTVMIVSFANAGLLNVIESAGLMMGANIGTTITAWIISGIGYKITLSNLILPLFLVGFPLTIFSRNRSKYWGEFIIGFALVFMGLFFLQSSVPDVKNNMAILDWLKEYTDTGFSTRFIYLCLGTLMTLMIQSSSAAIALTITMCLKGWLPLELGMAMVLGENIGTTITAELAALIGNVQGKRAARIHTLFNLIGVTWMIICMPWFVDLTVWFSTNYLGTNNPMTDPAATPYALSFFHTTFNLTNVMLLLPFMMLLVKASEKLVKAQKEEDYLTRLKYIRGLNMSLEIAIEEVDKEIRRFADITSRMNNFFTDLINTHDPKQFAQKSERIFKYEDITDKLEIEINAFITRVSEGELTSQTSIALRNHISICNDLERIGDIYYQMTKELIRKKNDKSWFSPFQRAKLLLISQNIGQAFANAKAHLIEPLNSKMHYEKAKEIRGTIVEIRRDVTQNFAEIDSLSDIDINLKGTIIFESLISNMDKVSDHIFNISETLRKQ